MKSNMELCEICSSKEVVYFVDTLTPRMALCKDHKPKRSMLAIDDSSRGERQPDWKPQEYPKEECYRCGNKNIEDLGESSLKRLQVEGKDEPSTVQSIPVIEYERWVCKYNHGCDKKRL